jgi:hypothetical protein
MALAYAAAYSGWRAWNLPRGRHTTRRTSQEFLAIEDTPADGNAGDSSSTLQVTVHVTADKYVKGI